MSNRQLFFELSSMHAAVLACVAVTMPCLAALRFPVWPVVFLIATLPVRAFLSSEMGCEPFKPAHIAAKAFLRRGRRHCSCFAALLTCVCDPIRLAIVRAKLCRSCLGWRSPESFTTSLACNHDGRMRSGLGTFFRAIRLLCDSGMRTGERVAAVGARLACCSIFALSRTVAPASSLGGILAKFFTASLTRQGDFHAAKISHEVEQRNSKVAECTHNLPHDRAFIEAHQDDLILLGQGRLELSAFAENEVSGEQ